MKKTFQVQISTENYTTRLTVNATDAENAEKRALDLTGLKYENVLKMVTTPEGAK